MGDEFSTSKCSEKALPGDDSIGLLSQRGLGTKMISNIKHLFLVTVAAQASSWAVLAQVVTYEATYSKVSGPSDFVSAIATIQISSSATQATDGTLYQNFDPTTSSWVQSLSFDFTSTQTYNIATAVSFLNEVTSMSWQNSSSPTFNPSVFHFTGSNQDDPTFTVTGSDPKVLTVTAGGNTYVLQQASFSAVPEPEEWAAIASSGLLAFAFWHRRSRKAAKA